MFKCWMCKVDVLEEPKKYRYITIEPDGEVRVTKTDSCQSCWDELGYSADVVISFPHKAIHKKPTHTPEKLTAPKRMGMEYAHLRLHRVKDEEGQWGVVYRMEM